MKSILVIWGIAAAGLFWACGDGTIATKSGDDEMALLNYGEFNPGGMSGLVGEALKACQEDPKCAEAMANSVIVVPADTDTESSDAAADTSNNQDSSGSKPSDGSSSGTSPASATGSSSSATEPSGNSSSSANVAPGSSSATTSSSSAALPTKIRGVCSGTSPAEKNTDVKWTFANLTPALKPKSFKWTFDEGASKLSSTDESPVVQYTTPNMLKGYGATLVVDEGLETESDPIPCTVVKITGIQVKDCECTASATTVVASESKPKDVTWTVDKCSGGTSFTYEWSNGASGTATTATVSVTGGSVSPKVTVTNSDGMTASPNCPTVTATEMPGAKCVVGNDLNQVNNSNPNSISAIPGQSFYFKAKSVTGINGSMAMALTIGNGSPKNVTISSNSGWGNNESSLTAPSGLGTYPIVLSADDEEVCTATLTVEYPKITSTGCSIEGNNMFKVAGQTFSNWDNNVIGDNVSMDLYQDNGKLTSLNVSKWNGGNATVTIPTEPGTYTYKLDYHDNTVCSISKKVELIKPRCFIGKNESTAYGASYTAVPGQEFTFRASNTNFSGAMSLSFNGQTQSINTIPGGSTTKTLIAPEKFDDYTLTLSLNGETMCTAKLTVAEEAGADCHCTCGDCSNIRVGTNVGVNQTANTSTICVFGTSITNVNTNNGTVTINGTDVNNYCSGSSNCASVYSNIEKVDGGYYMEIPVTGWINATVTGATTNPCDN